MLISSWKAETLPGQWHGRSAEGAAVRLADMNALASWLAEALHSATQLRPDGARARSSDEWFSLLDLGLM